MNTAWGKCGNTFFILHAAKSNIKPTGIADLAAKLLTDTFPRVPASPVPERIQEIMTHWKHHPFFNEPFHKFLLWFIHSTNLVYTCTDKANRFIKGGRMLFHTKFYCFFSSLFPSVNIFCKKLFLSTLFDTRF